MHGFIFNFFVLEYNTALRLVFVGKKYICTAQTLGASLYFNQQES